MDEAFVKEQDRRRKKRLPDEIYDQTGWSLPLAFDVECVGTGALTGETRPYAPGRSRRRGTRGREGRLAAPVGLGHRGGRGRGPAGGAQGARRGGRLPPGRPRVPRGDGDRPGGGEPDTARETLGRIARKHGVEAVAADSGYVEEGVSFGSERAHLVENPRVLLAWDRPTSSTSAGWARWVLERRFGQPVTAVRVSSLGRVDLSRYDVLVLPAGEYGDALGEGAVKRLRDWISAVARW